MLLLLLMQEPLPLISKIHSLRNESGYFLLLMNHSKETLVCCGPAPPTWLGSRLNSDTTQAEQAHRKSSLLAQFAAAMTASQC